MLHCPDEREPNYLVDILSFHSATFVTSSCSRVNGHFKKTSSILRVRGDQTQFQLKEEAGHQLTKCYILHIA